MNVIMRIINLITHLEFSKLVYLKKLQILFTLVSFRYSRYIVIKQFEDENQNVEVIFATIITFSTKSII